jgi:hypothetical protein
MQMVTAYDLIRQRVSIQQRLAVQQQLKPSPHRCSCTCPTPPQHLQWEDLFFISSVLTLAAALMDLIPLNVHIAHKSKTMLTATKWLPPVSLQIWDRVWRIVICLSLLRYSSHVCFVWWQFAVFDLSLHKFDCSLERTGQATMTIY